MRTIAIVEDAKDTRDLLFYLLADEYRVLRYGSGEEALRALTAEAPDLIVMDIELADVDGVEVLKRLRQQENFRNIPIVALTAHATLLQGPPWEVERISDSLSVGLDYHVRNIRREPSSSRIRRQSGFCLCCCC